MEEHTSNNGILKEEPILAPEADIHNRDFYVRSAEVQEIIGKPPHWLVRGGITGFVGVLVLVLMAASVIKYPEVIKAPLKLRAINEPKTVEAKTSGKLINLFFRNNARVKQGQILAWIESTASHKQVLELSAKVDSMYRWLEQNDLNYIRSVSINNFNDLGELQASFQTFEQACRTFITFLPGGYYSHSKDMLEQELKYIRQLLENLRIQKEIQMQNVKMAKREYEVQQKLAQKDVIAPLDLAKTESDLAATRLPLQQTKSAIINNYTSQIAKQKELMELKKQINEQKSIFRQSLNSLKSAIEQWKADYLIEAPLSGQLIYTGIIQKNQTIQAGQEVAFVKPDNAKFFGEMAVSQHSFGKIREGQEVLVRFSGYPDYEFGSVKGKIAYFSEFPVQDSIFLAKVNFKNGFETNYGKKLKPTSGMTGSAEIITQDMKLLERIYNNITKNLR